MCGLSNFYLTASSSGLTAAPHSFQHPSYSRKWGLIQSNRLWIPDSAIWLVLIVRKTFDWFWQMWGVQQEWPRWADLLVCSAWKVGMIFLFGVCVCKYYSLFQCFAQGCFAQGGARRLYSIPTAVVTDYFIWDIFLIVSGSWRCRNWCNRRTENKLMQL